ncbi:hypothetical protein A1F94_013244 [Pyrenophora tritici-repentis]|nr:hypothetical protein A1F94_013244 [Pyrenophora tritici-repentis]
MSTKPIRVWLALILILEELQIPYEIKSIPFQDIKAKPFIDLNPNAYMGKSFLNRFGKP